MGYFLQIKVTKLVCSASTNKLLPKPGIPGWFLLVMGRVRTRTRKKDSDLGFFAELGLGLAVGKIWWTQTRTRVQH